MELIDLHCLNSLLLIALVFIPAALAFRQYRQGEGISPPLRAAVILAQLAFVLQIFIGVTLLHERRRGSILHYSLGLLPALIFLALSWYDPQDQKRRMLATGIAWLAAGSSILLAFLIALA